MSEWQDISTAPKNIVSRRSMGKFDHEFGPYILGYVGGDVLRLRWWQSSVDPENICNFLGDCGNAYKPSHWHPLPSPPEQADG